MVGIPAYTSTCRNCTNYKSCVAVYNKTDHPLAWVTEPQTVFAEERVVEKEHEHAALKYGKTLDHKTVAKILPILEELGYVRKAGLSESDMSCTINWYLPRGKRSYRVLKILRADSRIKLHLPKTQFANVKSHAGFKYRKGGSCYIDIPASSLKTLRNALSTVILETEI
jgi:hypothetical protein